MNNQAFSTLLLLLFGCVFYNNSNGQIALNQETSKKTKNAGINTLFSQIEKDISGSRVVFLGEINHGDGNVFEIKTELVKFLHEKMGFNILAFESGIYDLYKAQQNIDSGMEVYEALNQSLFPIWTYSAEFQPLIKYLQENSSTIKVAGFDNQPSGDYAIDFLSLELDSFITKYSNKSIDIEMYDKALIYFYNYNSFPVDVYFPAYSKLVKMLQKSLRSIIDSQNDSQVKSQGEFLLQCTKSFYALAEDYYKNDPGNLTSETFKAKDSNSRDKQMADNLLFLLKKNPTAKVICWGAAEHFANNTLVLKNEELAEFKPMGSYIKQNKAIKSYAITFTTSGGTYAPWYKTVPDTVPAPIQNSLEYELMIADSSYAWINLKDYPKDNFVSNVFEFTPIEGEWREVFDAFFYVKNITPSHEADTHEPIYKEEEKIDSNNYAFLDSISMMGKTTIIKIKSIDKDEKFQIVSGKVWDAESDEAVPYASIQLGNKPYGTSANKHGVFQIKVPITMRWDTLWFSSIGYQKKGIKLEGKKSKVINCQLVKASYNLATIDISSEEITAAGIMLKVIKAIPKNYNMEEHSMSFYIKDLMSINDTVYRENEFAGELFYNKRIEKDKYLPFFNEARYSHKPQEAPIMHPFLLRFLPSFHLYYVVKNEKVFFKNKQKEFTFKLDTILDYNGAYVFKIHFKENSGFHIYGFIYVNTTDYAVIKYEYSFIMDANMLVDAEQGVAELKNMYITDFKNFNHESAIKKKIFTYQKTKDGYYYPKEIYFTESIKETDLKLNKTYYSTVINQFYFYNYRTDKKFEKKTWDVHDAIFPKPNENSLFWQNFVPPISDNVLELDSSE